MRKWLITLFILQLFAMTAIAKDDINAEIATENGLSVLKINGKRQVPQLIYHTLLTKFRSFPNVLGKDVNPSVELVKLAQKHGFHLTTLVMPLIWPKDDKPADYSKLDKIMDKHIELDPKVLTIPRIIGRPPTWWLKKHPEARQQYQSAKGKVPPRRLRNGSRYATPTSEEWRKAYYNALANQVKYLESKYGNHIIGYHPGIQSAGENFFPFCWDKKNQIMVGFSEPFRKGFIKFVKKKYSNLQALNKAWNTNLKNYDEIKLPTMPERIAGDLGTFRDPQKQRYIIDFMTYFQLPIAEVSIATAKIIKKITNNKKLTLFFYAAPQGGHYPLGGGQGGALSLRKLLEAPEIDIICNPYGYSNRQFGGIGILGNVQDSIIAHKKMYFVEDDTRTHKAPFNHFGKTKNMYETKEVYKRLFAQTLKHGTGRWWFDFGSGSMAMPELFELFESMRKIRKNFELVPFKPEVAIVFDDESPLYLRCSNEVSINTSKMTRDYPLMGAPFGRFLLSDVCAGKVPKETKVLFFFNAYKITPQQRQQLHKTLAEGGKTAVWFYAPGYIDGKKADVQNIEKLTGIKVEKISGSILPRFNMKNNFYELKKGQTIGVNVRKPLNTMFKIIKGQAGVNYLADYKDSNYAGMASKQMKGWKSVLFCGVRFGSGVFRALARDSGVHIFCNSYDSISGSANYIAITAIRSGKKTLRFTKDVDLKDIFTGKKLATGVKQYSFTMKKGETRIFLKK